MTIEYLEAWQWKEAGDADNKYRKCKHWPSQIHIELISAGIIDDPNTGSNELLCQWVEDRKWQYRTQLSYTPCEDEFVDLVFEGLDTFALIVINGIEIMRTDNMFREYRISNIRDHLLIGMNSIEIIFLPAKAEGRKLFEAGKVGAVSNGDPSRLYVRKAAYHYGWDWGPLLNTCGIWKPVYLENYNLKIDSQRINIELNDDLTEATLKISLKAILPKFSPGSLMSVYVQIFDADGELYLASDQIINRSALLENIMDDFTITCNAPRLWWPVDYGGQPLYKVVTTLSMEIESERKQATKTSVFGFRKVKLVERPLIDAIGTSFFFEINNVPIFCGGSNWIPPDSFHCRMTARRCQDWIDQVRKGGQNILRVWGGGIYESDEFYDACDRAGILVWQDFMFACGQYPGTKEFIQNVEKEAEENLTRLRDHPCIVILAGNNEDYSLIEDTGIKWDKQNYDWDHVSRSDFPARVIYEHVLPEVVAKIAPWIEYRPGSPYGGTISSDPKIGDIHQWNVWHGNQVPYQHFDRLTGRFISEFGMQGLPDLKTHQAYLTNLPPSEFHPQSKTNTIHNKATGADRRLALYVNENFRNNPQSLADYIYITQLVQHDALTQAYKSARRNWKGKGREYCSGALVWQMNDCWPCTSWSIMDYFLRPKQAYYAIKRELAALRIASIRSRDPVTAPLESRFQDPPTTGFYYGPWVDKISIWAVNSTLNECLCTFQVHAFDIESGLEVLDLEYTSDPTLLVANQSTDLLSNHKFGDGTVADHVVLSISLVASNGTLISRTYSWPEPFKFLLFPDRTIKLTRMVNEAGEVCVEVTADRPIRGLVLSVEDRDVEWSDNCFDLCPGEKHEVAVHSLQPEDEMKIRYYGQHE